MVFGAVGCADNAEPAGSDGGGSWSSDLLGRDILAGCENRGEPIVVGMAKPSEDELFRAELLDAAPLPPVKGDNAWTVEVFTAAGDPVTGAEVLGNMYMVDHDHALRQLANETSPGVYELSPLVFTMSGYWELKVEVTPTPDAAQEDMVFGFCIPR